MTQLEKAIQIALTAHKGQTDKAGAHYILHPLRVMLNLDTETEMIADMVVGFKSLREKFTSKVQKERPRLIDVHYVDGPLRDLDNMWQFTPTADGGCEVDFCVDFTFKNKVFEAMAGQYFDRAFRRMVEAFEARAAELYGSSSSSAQTVA